MAFGNGNENGKSVASASAFETVTVTWTNPVRHGLTLLCRPCFLLRLLWWETRTWFVWSFGEAEIFLKQGVPATTFYCSNLSVPAEQLPLGCSTFSYLVGPVGPWWTTCFKCLAVQMICWPDWCWESTSSILWLHQECRKRNRNSLQ